ncbi:hypothetical protein EDC56_1272 [Sinobacterium caligoides]|uniref:Uncharacterized protein n=1 Tax=Sinobacterium caligoides TaxID=933926 RepID=A0A3N2E1C0_9GAMM|nr:hypothetical protein [Sinobacterium caligoides]ROS05722.1 hypothetical protein EDC56_1272 [Sinobacterium caligoides]
MIVAAGRTYETFRVVADVIGEELTWKILKEFKPDLPRANGSYAVCLSVPKAENLGKTAQVYGHRLIGTIGVEMAMKLSEAYGGEIIWVASPSGPGRSDDVNDVVWVWSSDHGWIRPQQMRLFDFLF